MSRNLKHSGLYFNFASPFLSKSRARQISEKTVGRSFSGAHTHTLTNRALAVVRDTFKGQAS